MAKLKLRAPIAAPIDEIDRFTTFINRVWRPWLGMLILIGWTWQIVAIHIVPWLADKFWNHQMTLGEGYTDNETQWLAMLTGAIFFGRAWEKVQLAKVNGA